jgi:WD40 repeat protein
LAAAALRGLTRQAVAVCGDWVVTGSQDKSAKAWLDGALVWTFALHSDSVRAVAANSSLAATGSFDMTCRLWSLRTGEPTASIAHGWFVHSLAMSERTLVTGSLDCLARAVDLADLSVAELSGHSEGVYGVALTQDGHYGVTASEDGSARVWDLRAVQRLAVAALCAGLHASPGAASPLRRLNPDMLQLVKAYLM